MATLDAVQTELDYMLAVEAGHLSEAARIVTDWNTAVAAVEARDRRIGVAIMGTSAALWLTAIAVSVHLVTQVLP